MLSAQGAYQALPSVLSSHYLDRFGRRSPSPPAAMGTVLQSRAGSSKGGMCSESLAFEEPVADSPGIAAAQPSAPGADRRASAGSNHGSSHHEVSPAQSSTHHPPHLEVADCTANGTCHWSHSGTFGTTAEDRKAAHSPMTSRNKPSLLKRGCPWASSSIMYISTSLTALFFSATIQTLSW